MSPPAPNTGKPASAAHVAVPLGTIVLLVLDGLLLVALVFAVVIQPAGAAATGAQPSPTWTAEPVYTTAPAPMLTPAATATSTPRSSGPPHVAATPTATADAVPTAPPAPTATSVPTPPTGGG